MRRWGWGWGGSLVVRWLVVGVALGGAVGGVAPTSAAAQDVSTFEGTGDTFNGFTGLPRADCHPDITNYGASYTWPTVEFRLTTACASNPFTSPNWTSQHTGLSWRVDVDDDGEPEYEASFQNLAGIVIARVYANGSVVCSGTPTWDGSTGFAASFSAGCFGDVGTLWFQVNSSWDLQPGAGAASTAADRAPDNDRVRLVRTIPPLPVGDGPGVTSAATGLVDVFARGQDDALHTRHFDGATWSEWTSLGGVITSTPAAASRNPGAVDVFVRGQDAGLYVRHLEGGNWGAWVGLGGILTTAPAVVSRSPGTLDIFVAGFDRALYTRHFDGAGWSGWTNLGGIITATPAAASVSPGTISVFGRGQDDALWTQSLTTGWSGWQSLGGTITTAPGATSRSAGTLDVFARGSDNAVWTQRFNGGWGGWTSLGGLIQSPPAVVSPTPGSAWIFARGVDAALWVNQDDGGGFTGWTSLGGVIR